MELGTAEPCSAGLAGCDISVKGPQTAGAGCVHTLPSTACRGGGGGDLALPLPGPAIVAIVFALCPHLPAASLPACCAPLLLAALAPHTQASLPLSQTCLPASVPSIFASFSFCLSSDPSASWNQIFASFCVSCMLSTHPPVPQAFVSKAYLSYHTSNCPGPVSLSLCPQEPVCGWR